MDSLAAAPPDCGRRQRLDGHRDRRIPL